MSEDSPDEIKRAAWREHYKNQTIRRHEISIPWIEGLPDPSLASPETLLLNQEREEILRAAVSSLRPLESAVVLEKYFGGRSYDEIATEHGITLGNARVLCCRAIQHLRKHPALQEFLKARCHLNTPADHPESESDQ